MEQLIAAQSCESAMTFPGLCSEARISVGCVDRECTVRSRASALLLLFCALNQILSRLAAQRTATRPRERTDSRSTGRPRLSALSFPPSAALLDPPAQQLSDSSSHPRRSSNARQTLEARSDRCDRCCSFPRQTCCRPTAALQRRLADGRIAGRQISRMSSATQATTTDSRGCPIAPLRARSWTPSRCGCGCD